MPRVSITQTDLNRGKVYTPGWHSVRVTKFDETTAKDGSALYVYEAIGLPGDSMESVPCRISFSEKAITMSLPFAVACGKFVEGQTGEFDLDDSFVGLELKIRTGIRTDNGKNYTDVLDYRNINS